MRLRSVCLRMGLLGIRSYRGWCSGKNVIMTWAVLSPPQKHKRHCGVAGVVLSYPFKLSGFLALVGRVLI